MTVKTIMNEAERGCGFRKAGGLYLMGGKLARPCGKLPKILETCPCCGGGIKPSRGWTWITPSGLFEPGTCDGPFSSCGLDSSPFGGCRLYIPSDELAGLIWIGEKFYTPDAFCLEAAVQGISRRISAIPRDFVVGETVVFFAHRKVSSEISVCETCRGGVDKPVDGSNCPDCDGCGRVEIWKRGIFAVFCPDRIEYVVKEDDSDEKLERLEKRGVTLVELRWNDPQVRPESEGLD